MLKSSQAHPYEALAALLPRSAAKLPAMPAIDCTQSTALAESAGVSCPPFDDALVGLYLARMANAGWITSRQAGLRACAA